MGLPNKSHDEKSSGDSCTACGQRDYIILQEGMHLARRCRNCNKWSRWVPHTAGNLAAVEKPPAPKTPPLFPVPDEPARPATAVCDHRDELERLIHHLRGIENHLSIVTRALMNGGAR